MIQKKKKKEKLVLMKTIGTVLTNLDEPTVFVKQTTTLVIKLSVENVFLKMLRRNAKYCFLENLGEKKRMYCFNTLFGDNVANFVLFFSINDTHRSVPH